MSELQEFLLIIFLSVLLVVLFCVGALWFRYAQCHNRAEMMGFDAEWGITTKCMIKVDGQWLPMSRYRVIDE